MAIPVIDIFAGPGGLGEGFASCKVHGQKIFKTVLAIEMDEFAHETLTLRSFYRQFDLIDIPEDYYDFLKRKISIDKLYNNWPEQEANARKIAWKAKLGYDKDSVTPSEVDSRIKEALGSYKDWILLGGPPCQAYSIVGRSRRQQQVLDPSIDERVDLYKQYLRILAYHNPAVFIMENVKGILSAKTKNSSVFAQILKDLSDPVTAYTSENGVNGSMLECPGYRIYSLVVPYQRKDINGNPIYNPNDFVIKSEEYGVPQARHRVILIGVREGIDSEPDTLNKRKATAISKVLNGLPRLRSGLSKIADSEENWTNALKELVSSEVMDEIDTDVAIQMKDVIHNLKMPQKKVGEEYIYYPSVSVKHAEKWFIDERIHGACNHVARGHMKSDLFRYLFSACFAKVKNRSPKISDFPKTLLPDHKNIDEAISIKKFADRFRVQLKNLPSKTVTSHISKDGHYYIHHDPSQCRSLTVREAARIQTFPDNYFFCGPRTSQFIQVGNAVPPLLANSIAEIAYKVISVGNAHVRAQKDLV